MDRWLMSIGYWLIAASFTAGGIVRYSQGHTWLGIAILACAMWTAGLGIIAWRHVKK